MNTILRHLQAIYNNHQLLRLAFWLLIIIPGIPFILVTLAYLFYAFWPRDFSSLASIIINPSVTHFSLSAHGVNDNPGNWSDALQLAITDTMDNTKQHISLDWRPYSDNPLTCSVMAKRIGSKIGGIVAQAKNIVSVHAIGHSCGAFVALGICEAVKKQRMDIKIQTTYLDPVSIYGGFWWQYGVDHFGSCADFSDAYIDTHDTVPGSNEKLPHAHTFDITQLRVTNHPDEEPHNWPTKYYLNAVIHNSVPLLSHSSQDLYQLYPRGELRKISP